MEIEEVVFNMVPLKAPDPNGIQAIFYQSHWEKIIPIVCQTIKTCFQHPQNITVINEVQLVLIPKIVNATNIK